MHAQLFLIKSWCCCEQGKGINER